MRLVLASPDLPHPLLHTPATDVVRNTALSEGANLVPSRVLGLDVVMSSHPLPKKTKTGLVSSGLQTSSR
jgi:hypothetical protein